MNKYKKIIIISLVFIIPLLALFGIRAWAQHMFLKEVNKNTNNVPIYPTTWKERSIESGVQPEGSEDKHPFLNFYEERSLESIGIDPAKLPKSLTAELAGCAEGKLGVERFQEIKSGSYPSINEIILIQPCLNVYQ